MQWVRAFFDFYLMSDCPTAVNPMMKYDWIKKNQLEEDYQNARQWMIDSVSVVYFSFLQVS